MKELTSTEGSFSIGQPKRDVMVPSNGPIRFKPFSLMSKERFRLQNSTSKACLIADKTLTLIVDIVEE